VRKNAHDHPPRLRYGSVCSGIEAASVAWHPFGWSASFLSEIDPFPRAVLKHRFPGVPLHGDFTTIATGQYDAIDLLVGGTPCQSFSIAGLRGGMADKRGNLALEYLRLADRLRPRWLVWENVPGVLSSSRGRDFGSFLGGLGVLGYGFAYRVLDAQYFGLAQRRRRMFVVGYLGDWRCAAAVLFEPESLRGHPAPRRQTGQRVAPTVARGSPGGRVYGLDADTADSLVPMAFGGNNVSGPGRNNGLETCVLSRLAVRRLTPRECERLQGFPDDYTLIPWRKGVAPDGPRYKALGNSMAVPAMAFIGRRIQMVENLMSENKVVA
jgi:DNA (cytosine-5)-methyltransferase 1